MKEIKYRAYDGKRMYDVLRVDFEFGRNHVVVWSSGVKKKTLKSCELLQYTGLKDKNGKEIYEGDLIKSTETDEVYRIDDMLPAHRHDHSTNIGYFADGKYETRNNVASRYTGDDWMSWPEMYEVIGNIYENPELLKV